MLRRNSRTSSSKLLKIDVNLGIFIKSGTSILQHPHDTPKLGVQPLPPWSFSNRVIPNSAHYRLELPSDCYSTYFALHKTVLDPTIWRQVFTMALSEGSSPSSSMYLTLRSCDRACALDHTHSHIRSQTDRQAYALWRVNTSSTSCWLTEPQSSWTCMSRTETMLSCAPLVDAICRNKSQLLLCTSFQSPSLPLLLRSIDKVVIVN